MRLYSLVKRRKEKIEEAGKSNLKHTTNTGKQNNSDRKTTKNVYTKQELILRLKEMLEKKYALEQTMARLTGGETGVVELRAHISVMWKNGNWDGAELHETMFYKKAETIKESYKSIKKIQREAGNIKKQRKKDSITPDEAELYELILYIQYEDFYKELIEENDTFGKEIKRKRGGKQSDK